MQELPLNGFYAGEGKKLSDRRCINWIPTPNDAGSLAPMSLMSTSGLEDFGTINVTGLPALIDVTAIDSQVFTFNSVALGQVAVFVVVDKVFFVNGFGTLSTQDYPNAAGYPLPIRAHMARMATDGINCVICTPSNALNNSRDRLVYFDGSLGAGTGIDTEAIFGTADAAITDLTFIGGRYLYLSTTQAVTGFNRVFYSAIGGIAPSALDFFAPDSLNSQLVGMETLNDRLYLFAENRSYIYSLTASTDLPFQEAGEMEFGLFNSFTKCQYGTGIAGLFRDSSGSLFVGMVSGGGVQKISTRAIDQSIYAAVQDDLSQYSRFFRLFSFMDNGRSMLCVTGPEFTFIYEGATGIWHERASLDVPENKSPYTGARQNWQYIGGLNFNGEFASSSYLIGDTLRTQAAANTYRLAISKQDPNIGTENGQLVERTMISAPFNDKNQRMMVDEIQPQCEVDYSVPVTDWAEAKINISMSHDFGNTFEMERGLNIGRAGNYTQETRFMSMGYVRQAFTLKLRSLNPYPTRVIALLSRLTKGGA